MKVADLMTRDVCACSIRDSLNAAARIMWDRDCGCAPVVDEHGRLAGIVTDRDICMAAYTQGVSLTAIPVERVMSARVVTCARGDDLETALGLMRTHEIHRLPVADSRGRLLGILSLSDLVHYSGRDSAAPADAIEIAATISAIRRRRESAATASASPDEGAAASREPAKAPKKPRTRKKQG